VSLVALAVSSARRMVVIPLHGRVEASGAVFEAKFMVPWSFSEEQPPRSTCPSCGTICRWWRPNRRCSRSLPEAASGWRSQHLPTPSERKFWRCVESGEPPRLFGVEPPKPQIEAIRIVDMSASNAWAEFAAGPTSNMNRPNRS
jgi:hypothetical protein